MERTRYTAHTVGGLVDSASPLGARWVFDDACEDAFARTLNRAQASLFRFSRLRRPDVHKPVGMALWGAGGSPSLVWHAQAVGALLEFGYLPTAESIGTHLKILEWRLRDRCCRDPRTHASRDPWLLRTRHVAWVVACLAELPRLAIDPYEEEPLHDQLERALELHSDVINLAVSYLLGSGDPDGPAGWTAFDHEHKAWHEHWGSDELNAVNTLYSMVALCRAERHGWLASEASREDTPPLCFRLLDSLFDEIVVDTEAGRPEVYWEHAWPEPWARGDLPDAVVALLALGLLEYAGLLRETTKPRSREEERGIAMRDKAGRLAQILVFRALDRSDDASQESPWTTSVDAFIRARRGEEDEEEWAEGEWFMPSYSLGVRAVLETAAVSAHHKVVRDAFRTIQALSHDRPLRSGGAVSTWFDPTRPVSVRRRARNASKETWHAKVDISSVLPGGPDRLTRPPVTPAGLHAGAMAWGALRRSAAQVDPPELLDVSEPSGRAISLFREIEIEPAAERFRLRLRSAGGYEEVAYLSPEWCFVLRALADGPVTEADVRKKVNLFADEVGHFRRVRTKSGLANAVKCINRKFGVDLITRQPPHTLRLTATVRSRLGRSKRR